mmetsp:Transcript_20077/g.29792  ORF Transcript_20077/g.29792 Transcript_20077/m.29792 type:complete len:321 (-) Transcript_20077:83-1045(-)
MSRGETENEDEQQSENTSKSRRKSWRRSKPEPPLESYIPPYLRRVIIPYHGDFCQTTLYHPRLLAHLMAEGFLPIATRGALLPKLHLYRSVIEVSEHHVPKSTRKKSKRFEVTLNREFDRVVDKCHEQHEHCWLYPPLVQAFRAIHLQGDGMEVKVAQPVGPVRVRVLSMEVWSGQELVAGELGYSVGGCYTSLTGFSSVDSSGSVQLAALGRLLKACGFGLWDLGMDMEYKRNMGAQLYVRSKFVEAFHELRTDEEAVLRLPPGQVNAKEVIDNMPLLIQQMDNGDKRSGIPQEGSSKHPIAKKHKKGMSSNAGTTLRC